MLTWIGALFIAAVRIAALVFYSVNGSMGGFMSDQTITRQTENRQIPSSEATAVSTPDSAQDQKKRSLKGTLMMALCCAAPLLLVGVVAVLGISLGALANGLVTVGALLACPVAMYLMMRMMHKKEQATPGKQGGGEVSQNH